MVLVKHNGKYDRELLQLLMDGHVLVLSGVIVFVCWLMMLNKIQCGGLISITDEKEQQLLRQADLVIFQFPLWWVSMLALMNGYIDGVFLMGWA